MYQNICHRINEKGNINPTQNSIDDKPQSNETNYIR